MVEKVFFFLFALIYVVFTRFSFFSFKFSIERRMHGITSSDELIVVHSGPVIQPIDPYSVVIVNVT